MASGFGGNDEGAGSQDAGGGACYVKKGELRLFCDKHNRPVKLYCENHESALCHTCAIKDHQKPCQLEDISVVLSNQRSQLLQVKATLQDSQLLWKGYGKTVSACVEGSNTHFMLVERKVNNVVDDELAGSRDKEEQAAKLIDDEADEKIRKITEEINVKRGARLKKCHEEAEKHRQSIESRRGELLDDVTSIAGKTHSKLQDLLRDARDVMQRVDDAAKRVELLLDNDKELLKGAQQLITSLTETLGKKADESVAIDITRTVKGVRFIEGVGNNKYNGRVGGYEGKWEPISTLDIRGDIKDPFIVGCTSNDDMIISDMDNDHTYCFNMKTKISQRVITSNDKTCIASCVLLDDDTIVCGKFMTGCIGESLPRCISLYNRQWKLIRDITLPKNTSNDDPLVHVSVDQDGMIIAAELNQKHIYVIKPDDGSVITTITCEENIVLRGVLSTGDVIAQTLSDDDTKLIIIEKQGEHRDITHSMLMLNCCVDPLTDDLYVAHKDKRRDILMIDQLSGKEHQDRTEITVIPTDDVDDLANDDLGCLILARSVIILPNKAIVSDFKGNYLVLKNVFCV